MTHAEDHKVVCAFVFDFSDPGFGKGIEVGGSRRGFENIVVHGFEVFVILPRKFPVQIPDEDLSSDLRTVPGTAGTGKLNRFDTNS